MFVFSVYLANYINFLITQLTSKNIILVKNLISKYIKIYVSEFRKSQIYAIYFKMVILANSLLKYFMAPIGASD